MTALFLLALAISPTPPLPEPASKPAITRDTRPDLFRDEPPSLLPASEQTKTPPNETPTSFWVSNLLRTVAVLGFVVALVYLVLNKGLGRLMKLTGTSLTGKHMTLIERMPLGQKHSLYLIEIAGKRYVIGTGDQGANLITALESEKQDTPAPSAKEQST
jgi:flagellar biogenesis protein FliO